MTGKDPRPMSFCDACHRLDRVTKGHLAGDKLGWLCDACRRRPTPDPAGGQS